MERIILFGDHLSYTSTVLIRAFLQATKRRSDVEKVVLCDTSLVDPAPFPLYALSCALGTCLRKLFCPGRGLRMSCQAFANLYTLARKYRTPVIVPESRDINHPEFIKRLRREFSPTRGFSLWCVQIFKRDLLDIFKEVVNYHNSLLPAYRGLAATRWSLYKGEVETGFTFHLVDEGVDEGRILLQKSLLLPRGADFMEVDRIKALRAAGYAGRLLDLLQKGYEGRPQKGRASYFGRAELRRMTVIGDPSAYSYPELEKRLKGFGTLKVCIQGRDLEVTAIKRTGKRSPSPPHLSFKTADGVTAEAKRFSFLPYRVDQARRGVKRLVPVL